MKRTKYPSTKTIEYTIDDFANGIDVRTDESLANFDSSVNSYNFEYKNGALTESVGFEALTLPRYEEEGSVENVAQFDNNDSDGSFARLAHFKMYSQRYSKRKDKIIYVSNDGKVYHSFAITAVPIFSRLDSNKTYQELPKIANYTDGTRDCIVLYDDTDGTDSWNANVDPIHYTNLPSIHDFCVYKNRVFAVPSAERLTLRTEISNLLTWTSTTTEDTVLINFDRDRGFINKLLIFNGYLFAIRDFGISRLHWVSMSNYSISDLLFSGSRIYADTACVCGSHGLVLCKDGIYSFDNVSAKKLDLKLNRMLNGVANQNAVATFKDGIYYLSCRLNFNDNETVGCESGQYTNNALVIYDVNANSCSILRGVDIVDLCTIQYQSCDKLLACFNGVTSSIGQLTTGGQVFGANQTKFWRSPMSDMGYSDKIKYVKEVAVMSLYDITIKVFSESESRDFFVKGGNIISRIPVRIKGKQIGISIKSTTQKAYISNLKLSCNLVDNEYV